LGLVGLLGTADDWLNARTGDGISAIQKLLWQTVVAGAVAWQIQNTYQIDQLAVPFVGAVDIHPVLFILIAAFAIEATKGFIYVRAEYPIAVSHLTKAIGDAEKLGLLGDDILGQVLRCVRGIDVTDESVSIEAMKAVCLGGPGHYLGSEQTLKLMQTEYIYPTLGNRMSPKEWNEAGRPDLLENAIARKTAILAAAGNTVSPEIDAAIRARWNIYF